MRFERRLKPETKVDLTPLIDVVFQLVIFFMVSSVFKTAPGIPVDLPQSKSAESLTISELRIKILNDEQIYLNNTLTDIKGLANLLETERTKTPDAQVTIEGASDVSYQSLVLVLDTLRKAGIDNAGMLVLPEKK